MIDLSLFSGQRFYVVGLGTTGISAVRALGAAGAQVACWDDYGDHGDHCAHQAQTGQDATALTAPDLVDYSQLTALILSPGIAPSHRAVQAARAAGVDVISDVELLFRAGLKARALGITGTNGKSTVAALCHHVLQTLGIPCALGGNFGPATLALTDPGPEGFVVLELSSYQLELSPGYDLAAACLVNVEVDHLERHGTLANYAAAKARIFKSAQHKFVAGLDRWSQQIATQSGATLLPATHWPAERPQANLIGQHQRQNMAAVSALLTSQGLQEAAVLAAMDSFPGIPHRQQVIAKAGPWLFVNDSKATNVASTASALRAYKDIHWLAGGRAKAGGFDGLRPHLGAVTRAYIYGENAADLSAFCQQAGVPFDRFETLDQAVACALEGAGGTLLLSPAAASWDQYSSFEARGAHFHALLTPYITEHEAAA